MLIDKWNAVAYPDVYAKIDLYVARQRARNDHLKPPKQHVKNEKFETCTIPSKHSSGSHHRSCHKIVNSSPFFVGVHGEKRNPTQTHFNDIADKGLEQIYVARRAEISYANSF